MINNQIIPNQLAIPNQITSTIQSLSTSLTAIKPDNSETTQIITYVLVGTVVAGLLVYHYIKNNENL